MISPQYGQSMRYGTVMAGSRNRDTRKLPHPVSTQRVHCPPPPATARITTMAEREFPDYTVRSGASLEGSRYTAWLAVVPHDHGFPVYYAICENRSFRQQDVAERAA